VIGEFLHIDGVAIGQRMVARDREDPRLACKGRSDDQVGLFQWNPTRHELDVVFPQRTERIAPGHLHHIDLALRMKRLECLHDLHEVRAAGWSAKEAQPQRPLEPPRGGVRPLEHSVELLERRADIAQEPLPERGELDAAAGAVDELDAELVFERGGSG
jgi:hypothetical protein